MKEVGHMVGCLVLEGCLALINCIIFMQGYLGRPDKSDLTNLYRPIERTTTAGVGTCIHTIDWLVWCQRRSTMKESTGRTQQKYGRRRSDILFLQS